MKVKILVALMMAMVLTAGVLAVPASANTRSAEDSFFDGWAGYVYNNYDPFCTGSREKENDSSIYIENYSVVKLKVRGEGFIRSVWENETCNGNRRYGSATVPQGEYFINTWIYEDGGRSARLAINSAENSGQKRYVYGKWSPDSVGSYPVAND